MFSNTSALLMAGLLAAAPNEPPPARYQWGDPVDVALRAGKTEEVLALVDRDPTLLRAVSREMKARYGGETLLHRAAADGNVKLIEGLLDRGAEIDQPAVEERGNGLTPLHFAAWRGHVPAIELLLKRHANIDAEAPDGDTPVRMAAGAAQLDAARALLKAGAKNDEFVAASLGQLEFLKQRHSKAQPVPALRGGGQRTPLHYAAANGQLEVARWLIEQGADVNAEAGRYENEHGSTALHAAVRRGDVSAARLLLEAGANVNAPGYGFSPLHDAESVEMARLLLSRGADVNGKAWHDGSTPLHYAALHGNLELVKLLIESGADVNAKCDQTRGVSRPPRPSYETAADWAAWRKHTDVLDYLRKYGGRRKTDKTP
ncbi:MAG: ankyrin repeat domain-containing protein [Pirellulales bacterium]